FPQQAEEGRRGARGGGALWPRRRHQGGRDLGGDRCQRPRARGPQGDRAVGSATCEGGGEGKQRGMNRNLPYPTLIVVAATIVAVIYLVPSLVRPLPSWWKAVLPDQAIRLGLDLQGGMHLVLEVQTEKALEFSVERSVEDLKRELQNAHVAVTGVARGGSRANTGPRAGGGKEGEGGGEVKNTL